MLPCVTCVTITYGILDTLFITYLPFNCDGDPSLTSVDIRLKLELDKNKDENPKSCGLHWFLWGQAGYWSNSGQGNAR